MEIKNTTFDFGLTGQFTEEQKALISNFCDSTAATEIINNPGQQMVTNYIEDGSVIEQTITGAGDTFSFSRTFYSGPGVEESKYFRDKIQLSIDKDLNVKVSYWITLKGLTKEQAKAKGVSENDLSVIYGRAAESGDVVQGDASISAEAFRKANPSFDYTNLTDTVKELQGLGLTISPDILSSLDMGEKQM